MHIETFVFCGKLKAEIAADHNRQTGMCHLSDPYHDLNFIKF